MCFRDNKEEKINNKYNKIDEQRRKMTRKLGLW